MKPAASSVQSRPVCLDAAGAALNGDLLSPETPIGVVIVVHGSGSSRFSRRNRSVAAVLNQAGLSTLLLDLLTEHEERTDIVTAEFRFDIPLLAGRARAAVDWTGIMPDIRTLPLGLFGASTGAAAALIAAAERPTRVAAIVSRGGRPDLALDALDDVQAPTLLIVGSRDEVVLDLNQRALERLSAPKALEVVPGATHLFEEPGALDVVSQLSARWFNQHLREAVN